MNTKLALAIVSMISATSVAAVPAGWDAFIIRNGTNAPTINENPSVGDVEFIIDGGSQKAALGTSTLDGSTIGTITSVAITRYDDTSRFAGGSGPAVAPYFNIWITDGTNYAVVANEPSNPDFQPLFVSNGDGSKTYDLSYADLSNKAAKIFETPGAGTNTSWVHVAANKVGQSLTFADVAGFAIAAPSAAYITDANNSVGSGAPRELTTNVAYGFNWVFGDSLSNYVSGDDGYIIGDPIAVPEPASLGLLGLAGMLIGRRRRV